MTENKNIVKFESLYNRYISGIATSDEICQLREITKTSITLKEKLDKAEKVIKQTEDLKLMRKVDTPLALLKLKNRINEYPIRKNWLYYWQRLAAVLLLPLLIVSGFQFWLNNRDQVIESTPSTQVYNILNTPHGLRSTFELPDGTKVWLNGNTKLTYPLSFTSNERRVKLEGEAYFEVAKNAAKPFIVDMGELKVQAIGTAFNCMAYSDSRFIKTALAEGKVKVIREIDGKENGKYILNPGQVISYEPNSTQFYLEEGNIDKHLSWRTGKFIFRNDPLEEVCLKLGRWFNAEITIRDESLKSYSFTGTFQEEGLTEILDLISLTSPIGYSVSKRKANNNNEYETLKIGIMKK